MPKALSIEVTEAGLDPFQERGGQNNKAGNRFEDIFLTHRVLKHTPNYLHAEIEMSFTEQAGCFVDDVVLEAAGLREFYQLKADKGITWGENNGRLKDRFLRQQQDCVANGQDFRLYVVVANGHRAQSLTTNLPKEFAASTEVILFPRLDRIAQVARLDAPHQIQFGQIAASRLSGNAEWEDIAEAFHSARQSCAPDANGYLSVSQVVTKVRSQRMARVYTPWDEQLAGWPEVRGILESIDGFEFWVDRGYFEWRYPPADGGMNVSCLEPGFERFVQRVLELRPTTFDDLEMLLP